MKKYILTFLIIGTFGLYALYHHVTLNNQTNIALNTSPATVPVSNKLQNTISKTGYGMMRTKTTNSNSSSMSSSNTNDSSNSKSTTSTAIASSALFKDGTYTGSRANAFYGTIQVQAVISGGKLTDVKFLSYPNDRGHSIMVNAYAMPRLRSEAISAQSANVNTVSGASYSSAAFRESLGYALNLAKV